VYRVIYAFTDPQQDRRPPTGGSPQEMRIGHSIVNVRVFDENDWINPTWRRPSFWKGCCEQ
jgi:hypothetical protein